MMVAIDWLPERPALRSIRQPPPARLFLVDFLGCVTLVAYLVRNVVLFSDDYVFFGQAAEQPFGWGYLSADLFGHFSPVSRVVDQLFLPVVQAVPRVVFLLMVLLAAGVQAACFLLMRVLCGRSWLALAGSVLLGTSLTLVPLANWWTAGVNLLPAMAGSALCLAGVAARTSGRSVWWGILAGVGYRLAVLSYELTMLMAGYALARVILFHTRISGERLRSLLARSWWMWLALGTLGALSLVNYRVNYYQPAPPASMPDVVTGLRMSLFETVVPTMLGCHRPGVEWFSALGTLLGLGVLAGLLVFTAVTRRGAWRGWLFAIAGWLVPSAALVLNRVGLYGVGVVTQAFYFFLSTMLVLVGVLTALNSPPRPGRPTVVALSQGRTSGTWVATDGRVSQRARLATTLTLLVVLSGWWFSAAASVREIQASGRPSGHLVPAQFVDNLRRSAAEAGAAAGSVNVLDSDVPAALVPPQFAPYNRADRVAAVNGLALEFGRAGEPMYVIGADGQLAPASIDWMSRVPISTGTEPGVTLSGVSDLHSDRARGACFTVAGPNAVINVTLPVPVAGDRLVVRASAFVDRPTVRRLITTGPDTPTAPAGYAAANYDRVMWRTDQHELLDTVKGNAISALSFDSMTVGATICLREIAVGNVVAG